MMVAHSRKTVWSLALALATAAGARAQEVQTLAADGQVLSEVWVGQTDQPPFIDGSLEDKCWKGLTPLTGFTYGFENWVEPIQTKVYLVQDREALYVAFDCDEPHVAGIGMTATNAMEVWQGQDDLVDVFLVSKPGRVHEGGSVNYQFAVTAGGVKFDQYNGPEKELSYRYGQHCPVGIKRYAAGWVCELKLPFKALRIAPQMGQTWRLNLGRGRPQNDRGQNKRTIYSSWAPDSGQWKDEATYGFLKGIVVGDEYPAASPGFRIERVALPSPAVGDNVLSATVASPAAGEYRFRVSCTAPSGKTTERDVPSRLATGTNVCSLPFVLSPEPGEHTVRFLAFRDGECVYRSAPAAVALPPLVEAFADRNYYTSETEFRLNVTIPEGFRERLASKPHDLIASLKDVAGKTLAQAKQAASASGLAQRIPLALAAVAPGQYTAEAALVESGGPTVATASVAIEKYPPAPNEIKIDKERRVFLDNGRPFVALHWYFEPEDTDAGIRELSQLGFNHFFFFTTDLRWKPTGDNDEEAIRKLLAMLDAAQRHHGKVTVWWEAPTRRAFVGYSYHWRPEKLDDLEAMIPDFEKMVLRIKDHPALFGYHLLDEPGDSPRERNTHKRLLAIIRKHDPYHPAWVSFCRIVRMLPKDDPREVYDTAGAHLYWNPVYPDNIAAISMWVDMGVKALEPWRLPFIATMQSGMPSASVREMTANELRLDMYLAVIHGTTAGFGYYMYDNYMFGVPAHRASYEELGALNRQLARLFPIFSEADPPQEIVKSAASRPIQVSLEKHGGKVYLFAANTAGSAQRVQFQGDFLAGVKEAREYFKGERIGCRDGAFTADIPFKDARVYEIEGAASAAKLTLNVSSTALQDRVDVPGFFRNVSGAFYIGGQNAICVYGRGNTLESVARSLNDPAIFSYDPASRTAVCRAEKIRIGCGGELVLGEKGKPAAAVTLRLPENPRAYDYILCNGVLKVYHSRIEAARGLIMLMNIGRSELASAELKGFDSGHPWQKESIRGATADADGRLTGATWAARAEQYGDKSLPEIAALNGD